MYLKKIRIAIAEDHEIVRTGIVRLLNEIENFKIVGEYNNGKELLDALKTISIDVVILDIDMPFINGIEALKHIQIYHPTAKCLMLTMHQDVDFIAQLISIGAKGYLPKNSGIEELILAINTIHTSGQYINDQVTKALFINATAKPKQEPVADLTDREIDVVRFLCEGKNNKEIAKILYLSPRTIEVHRKNIARKTKTNNVQTLIKYAIDNGFYSYK